jgi:hypothetical protein
MILWGNAVNDTESVKMSLAALAAPSVTSRDALPLFSRSGDTAFSNSIQYFCQGGIGSRENNSELCSDTQILV